MKNKKGMIPLIIIALIGIVAIIYFGFMETGSIYSSGGKYAYAITEKGYCSYTTKYGNELNGYMRKVNVALRDDSLYDNDNFIWDIGLRTTHETYGTADDGIIAQKLCDGTYDCNYGYTSEEWELKGDKCYLVPQPTEYYRFENNQCYKLLLLPSAKTLNDFNTKEECKKNIIEESNLIEPETEDTGSIINNAKENTEKISSWFERLINKILGWFR